MDIPEVITRLNFVPSYLDLDFASFPENTVSSIYRQIEEFEDDSGTEDVLWTNNNLQAFVAFLLDDMDKAEICNRRVLTRRPKNIQAKVMKCLLLYKIGQMESFEEELKVLRDLGTDEYLIAEAKIENAYAYSRMGVAYYSDAISLYEEGIEKYPTEYAWKYRLAVIKRRCLHPETKSSWPSMNSLETFNHAKHLLESVVNNSADDNLRAMSYVELASLYCGPSAHKELLQQSNMSKQGANERALEYLHEANALVADNEKVLTEAGKALRRMHKYQEALDVLEKAYYLKPTSINCHQLGLVLQKIEGPSPRVIRYLEESKNLSCGTNMPALLELGKVYMDPSNAQYDEAMTCFTELTEFDEYYEKRKGFEWKVKCYKGKLQGEGVDYPERRQIQRNIGDCQRKAVRFAVMDVLKRTPVGERERISLGTLLSRAGNQYDLYSAMGNFKRLTHEYRMSLRFLQDLNRIRQSDSVHQELRQLVEGFYREGNYDDCLDLVMLLMLIDVEDRERLAVTTILNILETGSDDEQLVSDCFKRLIDAIITKDIHGHVRLIFDTETCHEEADRLRSVLEKAGLVIKENDEGILQFTDRTKSLRNAMSTNVAIICLFKDNNTNLLDNFPIDELENNHPVVLSMSINGSQIAPILQNSERLNYPQPERNAIWLKEFGEKIFNPLLEDLTVDNHHA